MFTKWNNDIMTKPARPPLDLGEALTRNLITTWSGLTMICKFTCVPLAGYILLMTPQLEVLKHLGHANFDDNRSAELK